MGRIGLRTVGTLALVIAGILATGSALADKPEWAGGDNGGKHERKERGKEEKKRDHEKRSSDNRDDRDAPSRGYFGDRQRIIVHDYYASQFRSGRCPPGLAKKHNGCMPPGQAKKWAIGRPLPRDVVYYDLPSSVVVQLGAPPSGHRYVRVASDILLITVGTSMVVDAIEDMGRR